MKHGICIRQENNKENNKKYWNISSVVRCNIEQEKEMQSLTQNSMFFSYACKMKEEKMLASAVFLAYGILGTISWHFKLY